MHQKKIYKKFVKRQDIVSDKIARFAGGMWFVYIHAVIFAVWIIINVVAPKSWDPYPFIFLTLVVSLEAIFLATFVLINQNKDARRSERRAEQDYLVDQKAERGIQEIRKELADIKSMIEQLVKRS